MDRFSEKKFTQAAEEIVHLSHVLYGRGLSPATSSNYSLRLGQDCCVITVSGKDKGTLNTDEVMVVDFEGKALSSGTPSAETLLHTSLYKKYEDVAAVLHIHSVNSTVLSLLLENKNELMLSDYEILKAFDHINSHEEILTIPLFENTQDISALAQEVNVYLNNQTQTCYGYLIRGHGLYVWGNNSAEAMKYLETFEFLFACELERRKQPHLELKNKKAKNNECNKSIS